MKLSIICPFYNEERYLPQLLGCIENQDFPKDEREVLFIDGGSTDGSLHITENFCEEKNNYFLFGNLQKTISYAFNIGLKHASGDYIIRLDAHAWYPSDYCSTLVRLCEETGADNIGCVCQTKVLNENEKGMAICEVLSNPLGVGNSQFRIGVRTLQRADTVPFGCFPKKTFERYGLYDTRLVRNQDIEFNHRIIAGGGSIYLTPDVFFVYYAREKWSELASNNFANGKWNILTVYYSKKFSTLNVRHFIPLLFVLSLIVPTLLALLRWPFILVSAASLLAYLCLVSIISFNLARKKGLNFFYLVVTFFVLHLSYGWGSLCGLFTLMKSEKIA